MEKAEKPPLARAITYFVSNANLIGEEVEQVIFDGCSILHLILCEKTIRCQDTSYSTSYKYTIYVISNFRSASVVFDGYLETLTTTDNTHKWPLTCYLKKKNAFLRNTVNKHSVINVTLTELIKP